MFAAVLTLTCVFNQSREHAAGPQKDTKYPVLLELFTSEGCSSCPPADNWVAKLDSRQPISSEEIIVLSEHVDYWDHDGWKDPFSSAALTERQGEYERKLRLGDVYTPQVILNGADVISLTDREKIEQAFQNANTAPAVSVRIDSAAVDSGQPGILRGRVEVDANPQEHGDVFVVTALDHADTQVLKGENGGHHLSYVGVVQNITKIGKLEKGKSFAHDFTVKLKPGTDSKNLRVIAFVQEPGLGKVIGAAMQKGL